jgi:hypothetical protein
MLFGILFGVIQCFFGYRLFKVIIGIIGFILGAALAGTLSYTLAPEIIVVIIAGVVGGLIGATTMLTFYYVGIFSIGAILGGILGSFVCSIMGLNPIPVVIILAVTITGILALLTQKYMIIASTAFGGSWLAMTGIVHFITGAKSPVDIEYILQSRGNFLFIILLCWIVLGIIGLLSQLKWLPTDLKREERDLAEYVLSKKDE